MPVQRSEVGPAQAPRDDIVALVVHDAEKRVIGIEYPTFEIPDENADDIDAQLAAKRVASFLFRNSSVTKSTKARVFAGSERLE